MAQHQPPAARVPTPPKAQSMPVRMHRNEQDSTETGFAVVGPDGEFPYLDHQDFGDNPVPVISFYGDGTQNSHLAHAYALLHSAPGSGFLQPVVFVERAPTEKDEHITFDGKERVATENMTLLDPRCVITMATDPDDVLYEPRKWMEYQPPWARRWLHDHPEWPDTLWQPPAPFSRYASHLDALDALAEQRRRMDSAEGRAWAQHTSHAIMQRNPEDTAPTPEAELQATQAMLHAAVPYYWTQPMAHAVRQAATVLPDDATLQPTDLPSPAGWAWYQQPIQWPQVRAGFAGHQWLAGYSWHARPTVLLWMPWIYEYNEGRWAVQPGIPNGWLWGASIAMECDMLRAGMLRLMDDDLPRVDRYVGYQRDYLSLLASSFLFLQQKVMTHTSVPTERHMRKRLQRERWQHVPDVQVVQLRKRQGTVSPSGEHQPVDWQCQWWVGASEGGFWRSQPCGPGRTERKHIWILPFVKGPQDKPLKDAAVKIFKVAR
jgi:hypothetical protein